MNRGVWYGALAYLMWGFFPVYFKLIKTVPADQILNHRVIWSLIFLLGVLAVRKDWQPLREALKSPRTIGIYFIAALLLAANWLTYIWGVNSGYIVETSLGYFINPLFSVLFGMLFLRERLRPFQWLPVGLAVLGVVYLTLTGGSSFAFGAVPWLALALATTFGLYGLVKKVAPLNSLHSLSLETLLMFLPGLAYLLWAESQGVGAFGHTGPGISLLLVFSGVLTATPLLLFGSAARQINLATLGMLQYIAPTCQFLLGVFVYGESFDLTRLVGFSLIWIALALYSAESVLVYRRAQAVPGIAPVEPVGD